MSQKISTAIKQTLSANILALGISALNAIFITRLLGPEGKGYITSVTVWATVIGTLACCGIPTAYTYFRKKQLAPLSKLNKKMFVWLNVGWPIIFIVGVSVSIFENSLIGFGVTQKDFIVGANCAVFMIYNMLFVASQSLDSFGAYNFAKVCSGVLYFTVSILFIKFIGTDPFWVAWAQMFGYGVAAIFLVKVFGVSTGGSDDFYISGVVDGDKKKYVKPKFFGYAIKTFGSESLGVISTNLDKIVLLGLMDSYNVGLYGAAFGLSRLITQMFSPIAIVMFPRTASESHEKVLEMILQAFRAMFIIGTVVLLVVVPTSNWLTTLAFGVKFEQAASSFMILSIDAVVASLGWLLAQAFNSLGHPGAIFMRQLLGVAIGAVGFFVLIPLFGIAGAALSMLLASISRFVLTVFMLRSRYAIEIYRYIPQGNDFQLVGKQIIKKIGK